MTTKPVVLVKVTAAFCEMCLRGAGGVCNVPSCALCRSVAPDIDWRDRVEMHCSWESEG